MFVQKVDGNLIGEVKLLTDRELEEPDLDIRVPGLERFTRTFPEEECDVSSSEEQVPQKSSRSSFFSFLSMLRQSSPSSRVIPYTGVSSSLPLKSPRRRALRWYKIKPELHSTGTSPDIWNWDLGLWTLDFFYVLRMTQGYQLNHSLSQRLLKHFFDNVLLDHVGLILVLPLAVHLFLFVLSR